MMMSCGGGVLQLLTFFVALKLVYGKHFILETEDKKNISGLFTEKGALPNKDIQKYKSLTKPPNKQFRIKYMNNMVMNDYKELQNPELGNSEIKSGSGYTWQPKGEFVFFYDNFL